MYNINHIVGSAISIQALLFLSFFCFAQMSWSQNNIIPISDKNITMIRADEFNNIYTITSDNVIKRYDNNYKMIFDYSFYGIGDISEFDTSNPQKLMIFFSDYQIIVFLDNTLSEIKRLDLESLGYWNITSIARSPDNFIWLYDPINFKLIKIDENGKEVYSSSEFYFGKLSNAMTPSLVANNNYVACYTDSEYMIFDNFGEHKYSNQKDTHKIILFNEYLIYSRDNKLLMEKIKPDFNSQEKLIFENNSFIKDFHLSNKNKILILEDSVIKRINLN